MNSQADGLSISQAGSEQSSAAPDTAAQESFTPTRTIRFLCSAYRAHELAVLDIGCGSGEHLVHFGPGSLGLDAVEENVAGVRALGLEAVVANVEDELPSFDRSFDAAFCSNLIEHLVAPHLFLLRLHRVLNPAGLLFVMVPTVPPNRIVELLVRRYVGHNGYLAKEHIYAFTPRTAAFMVQRAGFEVLETVFVAARNQPLLRWAEPFLREIGISALVVGRRAPGFVYPDKRVRAFTPTFMSELDRRS